MGQKGLSITTENPTDLELGILVLKSLSATIPYYVSFLPLLLLSLQPSLPGSQILKGKNKQNTLYLLQTYWLCPAPKLSFLF